MNLFFEASTRTRTSFEIAAKRLGADAVSITASGVQRLQGRIAGGHAEHAGGHAAGRDRHAARGLGRAAFSARHLDTPIINAGDGTHEHPTQALLDARTILDRGANARRAAGGDHRRHRAQPRGAVERVTCCRSSARDIVLCGPASLLPAELAQLAPGVTLTTDMARRSATPT